MRYGKILTFIVPLLAVAACDDSGVTGPRSGEPMALIRLVNTATDIGTVDFRFIDRVENLPTLLGVDFRNYSGGYQRTYTGTRPARVFPFSLNPDSTQIMLVDTMLTLSANARYTMVYAGQTTANQDRLAVFEDPATLPTPPAGQIAVKALHGAFGTGNVDVYVVPVDTTNSPTPANFQTVAAHVFTNVSYLSQSDYANVPTRTAPGLYRFVVTAAGSDTPLFATTPNLPGAAAPAGATYGPQPGVRIAGSVLTVVVASGSVPGSRGSVAANQTPTSFLMIDKQLNP
jgi:hypothetical protein